MPDHSICLIWYQVFTKPCMSRFRFEIELMLRTIELFDKWYALKSSGWGSWEDWWRHWVPTFSRVASRPHGRNSPTWLAAPLWEVHLHSSPQQPKLCSFTSELGKSPASLLDLFPFPDMKRWETQVIVVGPWMVKRWWWTGAGCWPPPAGESGASLFSLLHPCTIAVLLTIAHCSLSTTGQCTD